MSLPALDNLVRIGQLKAEPRNEAEAKRMLAMARTSLADAQLSALSPHRADSPALTTLRMRQPWQPFAGMVIAAKTDIPSFSAWRIP